MKLFTKKLIGIGSRILHPSTTACMRCWRSWEIVKSHATHYRNGQGCFPLCEECWQELTPEQRLPFYRKLYNVWIRTPSAGLPAFQEIKDAVLAGK